MKHLFILLFSYMCLISATSTSQDYWILRTTDPIRGAYFAQETLAKRLTQMKLDTKGFHVEVKTYAGEPVLYLQMPRPSKKEKTVLSTSQLLDLLLSPHQLKLKYKKNKSWEPLVFDKSNLKNARLSLEHHKTGQPEIVLTFTPEGRERFAEITRQHVGHKVGIFIDNALLSSPIVQEPITQGTAIITGRFTLEEATRWVNMLNAPAMHYPLERIAIGSTSGNKQ